MTSQLLVRIDSDTKNKLNLVARREGKTSSDVVRELVSDYINERDMSAYIEDLWERIGKKIINSGIKEKDINKIIKEVRRENK
ncbi:MAG: CopG family transcriptional regulator [Ignavibacteria bacterium GWB2_35_12]|nr:MAG: CopG family transcriptional regulator [Ignavibacteria bacterium GWB2_35_12]OGU92858.1 MAG: CopG family transcriptional regulator [Ignavibacteria bacterium RIFOXYA2_FULL_35_10]OGV19557.1 MAG: CopG family transcriptional regulator [Ignavibacteria bacterium RIFOXYC2_FULL_35_21]